MMSSKVHVNLNVVLILMAVYTIVLGAPRWMLKSPSSFVTLKKPVGCIALGKPVSMFI